MRGFAICSWKLSCFVLVFKSSTFLIFLHDFYFIVFELRHLIMYLFNLMIIICSNSCFKVAVSRLAVQWTQIFSSCFVYTYIDALATQWNKNLNNERGEAIHQPITLN